MTKRKPLPVADSMPIVRSPTHSYRVTSDIGYLPAGVCAVCGRESAIMIYRGQRVCSGNCEKIAVDESEVGC
jgi:hypothetical protein